MELSFVNVAFSPERRAFPRASLAAIEGEIPNRAAGKEAAQETAPRPGTKADTAGRGSPVWRPVLSRGSSA